MGEKTESLINALSNRGDVVRTTVNINRSLLGRFKEFCSARGILMSDVVNALIDDFLKERDGDG